MPQGVENESTDRSPKSHLNQSEAARRGNAFKQALRAIVPTWSHAEILALFSNRVGWTAIDNWCAGRRGVPQWAHDIVTARGRAILDPMAHVPIGPGSIVGKYNLPFIKEKARREAGSV